MIYKTVFAMIVCSTAFSCGGEKNSSAQEDCQQKRSRIDATLAEVAVCSVDADCSYKGLHPHYGCFFAYNKSKDTTLVEELVNAYSTGSCWDGSSTDCASVGQEMLKCKEAKCTFER